MPVTLHDETMWDPDDLRKERDYSSVLKDLFPAIPSPRIQVNASLSANRLEDLFTATKPHASFRNGITSSPDEPDDEVQLPRVIPQPKTPRSRFNCLVQWEGVVTSAESREFTAELKDLTRPDAPRENATFSLEDVSDNDRDLVTEGAVFYWAIGYQTSKGGQKTKESRIRFRRLPTWTSSQLRKAAQRAEELKELFGQG